MLANSFTIMRHPPELVEYLESLAKRNVAFINSALTHGGFLVGGKFFDYREIDPDDPSDQEHIQWREKFTQLCADMDVLLYEACVAFGISHPATTSIALSSSRPERTADMIRATTQVIDPKFWDALRDSGLATTQW